GNGDVAPLPRSACTGRPAAHDHHPRPAPTVAACLNPSPARCRRPAATPGLAPCSAVAACLNPSPVRRRARVGRPLRGLLCRCCLLEPPPRETPHPGEAARSGPSSPVPAGLNPDPVRRRTRVAPGPPPPSPLLSPRAVTPPLWAAASGRRPLRLFPRRCRLLEPRPRGAPHPGGALAPRFALPSPPV